MAFIRCTVTNKVAGEERATILFLNTEFISRAAYSEHDATLQIVLKTPNLPCGYETLLIKGDEAKEALEVLRRT